MEIRRLNFNDAEKLVGMVAEFRSDTSNISVSERFLKNDANYLVACLDAERIIGFILGYRMQRYDGQNDMVYIHEVGVLEDYWRKGIGKRMMGFFLEMCRSEGISKVFLTTEKSNKPAVCLYESMGAKPTHNDDIVYWFIPDRGVKNEG